MILKTSFSNVAGEIDIPASKSHSIRAIFIAGLADGETVINDPLFSEDVMSAINVMKNFGAKIDILENKIMVKGVSGNPVLPKDIVNVGNSGTTLRFAMFVAALIKGKTTFTGDEQIKKRPLKPLADVINNLGGRIYFINNNYCAPVIVEGKITGGASDIDAFSSQYLSASLISCPMLNSDTKLNIVRLNEIPYVEMTLWWLDKQKISYQMNNFESVYIKGNQKYSSFECKIPGDFSSATFFMALAAISGEKIVLKNLDINDKQGDKEVLNILHDMGAIVEIGENKITVKGSKLVGRTIDMNSIPDALPALAVVGCFAEGETRLVNVEQARYKETDRIKVMKEELSKLGADIEEVRDGLIIRKSDLKGGAVSGNGDHRVVMALTILGLCIEETLEIDTAESVNITFPQFFNVIKRCGGKIELND